MLFVTYATIKILVVSSLDGGKGYQSYREGGSFCIGLIGCHRNPGRFFAAGS